MSPEGAFKHYPRVSTNASSPLFRLNPRALIPSIKRPEGLNTKRIPTEPRLYRLRGADVDLLNDAPVEHLF